MAVADHNYCFTYIDVGCNVIVSGGGVFQNCSLYTALENSLLPEAILRVDRRGLLCTISRMNVWRTLHLENLYPYHDQRVQHLEPGDHAQRMDLCHWVNAHPELLNVILFTDEASFTRKVNRFLKLYTKNSFETHHHLIQLHYNQHQCR